MKWAKPKKKIAGFAPVSPQGDEVRPTDEVFGDFNAPLYEQQEDGGIIVEEAVRGDEDVDAAEAERRLSDPDDRTIPFKPSR